jgi:2-polyprenyl-3-methyl-5-hydroxy-6-metoxy-1,4-benzoquinol methylase
MSERILAGSDWSHDALERVDGCPACGVSGKAPVVYPSVTDLFGGVSGSWCFYACPSCASLYLDPRPAGPGLAIAYRTYYTHEPDDGGKGSLPSILGRLVEGYLARRFGLPSSHALHVGYWLFRLLPTFRQQLDYFLRHIPEGAGRLLDVGCGNGAFLSRVSRAGWQAEGIEPDDAAASVARKAGCRVATATLDTFEAGVLYDVITMSHVIEHVPDPARALRFAWTLLEEGGTLWLATPNASAPGRRRYGKDWRGLEVPRHTVIFTHEALENLLRKAGYEDIRFRRRGRGARYSLDESYRAAKARRTSVRRLAAWWVDICATFSPFAGEELVVTARKRR